MVEVFPTVDHEEKQSDGSLLRRRHHRRGTGGSGGAPSRVVLDEGKMIGGIADPAVPIPPLPVPSLDGAGTN
jgi:hypothetical protein